MSLREWLGEVVVQEAALGEPASAARDDGEAYALAPADQALAQAIAGLETAERAHMAAFERFSGIIDAVCAESGVDLVAATTAPCAEDEFDVAIADAAIGGADESAEDQAEVGAFLAGLLTQVDGLRSEIAAKVEANAARRLDRVGRTLADMSGYVEEAEEAGGDPDGLDREDTSAVALRQLAVDVARFIEVVEARFERTNVAGAGQMADLRGEFGLRIDELVARIADCERRVAQPEIHTGDALAVAPVAEFEADDDLTFDFTELTHSAAEECADLDLVGADEVLAEGEARGAPHLTLVASAGVTDDAAPESATGPDWSPPPARRRRSFFRGRGSRGTEPQRAQTSIRSTLIALSCGALLGMAAGGYAATSQGAASALPERVAAALGLSPATALPLRTREAPTFAVVTVAPKPSQ